MSKYWRASGKRRGIRKTTYMSGTTYDYWDDALGKRTIAYETKEYVVCDMFTTTELPDLTNAANIKCEIDFEDIPTGATIGLLPTGFSFDVDSATFNTIKGLSSYITNSGDKMEISKSQLETIISRGLGYHYDGDAVNVGSSVCKITITYNDLNAKAIITSIAPNKKTLIGNDDNTLSWTYKQDAGLTQTHYDLQISANNGVTWTTLADKAESSTSSHTIAGGTLATGNYLWRVRVYTRDGAVVSSWASGEFTVRNNASTSGVACDGAPMPTITWTAVEQVAYQVRMGDYDSGTIYSSEGKHIIPRYFADDVYGITVRTQTASGVWSAWTNPLYVEIVNEPGDPITLTAFAHDNGVGLTWEGEYDKYYVLRDGVPIAVTADTSYYDALAYGEHIYEILAPAGSGHYTLSNAVVQSPNLRYDMITALPNINWLPLRYASGNPISRSYSASTAIAYREFAGRADPIAFVPPQGRRTVSLQYAVKTAAEAKAIEALRGKLVAYKDMRGGRIIGIVDNVARTVSRRIYEMALSITQVDYQEEVEYATDDADR